MRSFLKMTPTTACLRMLSKRPISPTMFTTSRLNWQARQSSRRRFTVSFYRSSQPSPSPRVRASQNSNHTPPPPPPVPSSSYSPKNPRIVVGAVLGTCIGIFIWHSYNVQEYLTKQSQSARENLAWYDRHLVLSMRNLREGRYHTLLTSTLTHYNLTHLGLNMFALWGFGQTVVAFYGVPTFAILWVGSGIAGGLLQSYFWVKNPNPYVETKAMGASGSILGIFAALTCVMPMATVTLVIIPMPMFVAAAATIGLSVGALKEGWMPYVGHADHLGGMAFGAFWWLVAMRRGSIRHLRRMR